MICVFCGNEMPYVTEHNGDPYFYCTNCDNDDGQTNIIEMTTMDDWCT